VPDDGTPLQHLSRLERRLLGWAVLRTFASQSPRFRRALEENGPVATVRMACVNTLRLYGIGVFLLGLACELARTRSLAYAFMALAALCVLWSCWCLLTAIGPERAYKRERAGAAERRTLPGRDVLDS
jgi:hypothetical protein